MKLLADGRPDRLRVPDAPGGDERHEPGRCPDCGMKLLPARLVAARRHAGHGDHERTATTTTHAARARATRGHDHAAAGGIEWEDDMVEVNRITTPANMRWKLIDRADRRREPRRSTGSSASATG